jgi:hypothetical protein
MKKEILHIITNLLLIIFWKTIFVFKRKKNGNEYHLGCTPSEDFYRVIQ